MNDASLNKITIDNQQAFEINQTLGNRLVALREARGWSIEQVATQLNLAPRQIRALECDNYAILPSIAIVRGFIRAYAKLLKVDAVPLLEIISLNSSIVNKAIVPARTLSVPFSQTQLPSLTESSSFLRKKQIISAALIIGVLVIGWVEYQTAMIAAFMNPDFLKLGKTLVLSNTSNQSSLLKNVSEIEIGLNWRGEDLVIPVEKASTPAQHSAAPDSRMITPIIVSPLNAPSLSQDSIETSKDILVLKLKKDSWIEIKRPNNTVITSRLMKMGAVEEFEIAESVSLVIGNAEGVEAIFRGHPLEIKGNTHNNVARLKLGGE